MSFMFQMKTQSLRSKTHKCYVCNILSELSIWKKRIFSSPKCIISSQPKSVETNNRYISSRYLSTIQFLKKKTMLLFKSANPTRLDEVCRYYSGLNIWYKKASLFPHAFMYNSRAENEGCDSMSDNKSVWARLELNKLVVILAVINN
jgi:hypothetical protein